MYCTIKNYEYTEERYRYEQNDEKSIYLPDGAGIHATMFLLD